MKNWKFVEISSGLVLDWEEEVTIVGTDIEGWNDQINFSDLESIVSIEMKMNDKTREINTTVTYLFEEAESDIRISKLIEVAKAELMLEFNNEGG